MKPIYIGESNIRMFSVGGNAYTYESWLSSTGKITSHAGDGASVRSVASSDTTVSSGTWYHVTAVYDRDTALSLYINGSLESTQTGITSYSATNYSSSTGEISGYSGSSSFNFNGQLDDFKFFHYALTPSQVKTIYNSSAAVLFAPITGSP